MINLNRYTKLKTAILKNSLKLRPISFKYFAENNKIYDIELVSIKL